MIVNDFSVKYWFLQIIITAALDIVWVFLGGKNLQYKGSKFLINWITIKTNGNFLWKTIPTVHCLSHHGQIYRHSFFMAGHT